MAASSGIELKRQIGLYAATAITVGNIIGSGIFRPPHSVAQELPGFTPVCLAAFMVASTHAATPLEHPVLAGNAGHPLMLAFALSMITILFAYDGWTDSTYVAGEVLNPQRNMPI